MAFRATSLESDSPVAIRIAGLPSARQEDEQRRAADDRVHGDEAVDGLDGGAQRLPHDGVPRVVAVRHHVRGAREEARQRDEEEGVPLRRPPEEQVRRDGQQGGTLPPQNVVEHAARRLAEPQLAVHALGLRERLLVRRLRRDDEGRRRVAVQQLEDPEHNGAQHAGGENGRGSTRASARSTARACETPLMKARAADESQTAIRALSGQRGHTTSSGSHRRELAHSRGLSFA